MKFWIVLVILAAGAAIWIGVRERRKGDFAFRLDKLHRRETQLIAGVTKLGGELDFLDVYRGTPKERLAKQLTDQLSSANADAVQVADRLEALRKRSRSWFDFSDLYVDIGMVEEQLEKAEAAFEAASRQFAKLDR